MLTRILDAIRRRRADRSNPLDLSSSAFGAPGAVLGLAGARRPRPNERRRIGDVGLFGNWPQIGAAGVERRAVRNVRAALAREQRDGWQPDPMAHQAARFAAAVRGAPRPERGAVSQAEFARLVRVECNRLAALDAREYQL